MTDIASNMDTDTTQHGGDGVAIHEETKKAMDGKRERKMRPLRKDGKERKKAHHDSFASFIYKVLKQVHPDIGISSRAMAVMDSMLLDLFDRIASEAGRLARSNKRHTIGSREIQTACRLMLPTELGKHAVSEGTKSVVIFQSSYDDGTRNGSRTTSSGMSKRMQKTSVRPQPSRKIASGGTRTKKVSAPAKGKRTPTHK